MLIACCLNRVPEDMIAIMSDFVFDLLDMFEGRDRSLNANEHLFHREDAVTTLYIVTDGEIHLIRYQESGDAIILQRARTGDLLAEASLFSDRYHCAAVARTRTTVTGIPKKVLRARLRHDPDFAEAWAAHFAREIQNTRFRSEILSLRTVSARLDAWLTWHAEMPPKGVWNELAFEIGVSPEALYREMAKRRT